MWSYAAAWTEGSSDLFHFEHPISKKSFLSSFTSAGNSDFTIKLDEHANEKHAGMATSEVNFRPSPPRFTGRVH